MSKSNLLCVMSTSSNKNIVEDQIESLFWGLEMNFNLIIVNDGDHNLNFNQNNIFVIKPQGAIHSAAKVGFKINEGLKWAIDKNIYFKYSMILDDDALLIRKGIDDWFVKKFENNKKIGIIGVGDDEIANKRYSDLNKIKIYNKFIYNWLKIKNFQIPKKYLFYAVNFQSYEMIKSFYDSNLLNHDKEIWPYPCETFQTIMSKLLNFEIYFHGQYPNNLSPPLYVMHHGTKSPLDPRKISKKFLIHHSIKRIKNTDEWEVRNYYKKLRKTKWMY